MLCAVTDHCNPDFDSHDFIKLLMIKKQTSLFLFHLFMEIKVLRSESTLSHLGQVVASVLVLGRHDFLHTRVADHNPDPRVHLLVQALVQTLRRLFSVQAERSVLSASD